MSNKRRRKTLTEADSRPRPPPRRVVIKEADMTPNLFLHSRHPKNINSLQLPKFRLRPSRTSIINSQVPETPVTKCLPQPLAPTRSNPSASVRLTTDLR
ncbi:unnamed protein product [Tenebrio molitor]|nr:unnamed protein product [Tenebrio molitor]